MRYLPPAQGLYDPRFEHDACGVGFVAHLKGSRSHQLVRWGIEVLNNLDHRGASGSEINTGDGAGILIQVPDRFLREVVDFELPPPDAYAVGLAFLPADSADPARADAVRKKVEDIVASEGLTTLGWRVVPTDPSPLGQGSRAVMPSFAQLFISGDETHEKALAGELLERRAFIVRKRIEHEIPEGVYFPSLSTRTLVYKGMLRTDQLAVFYPDLSDERLDSALALVHSRFSTNTFPAWPLAHPYRYIAHNGEINTVMGNRNWIRAREALMATDLLPGDIERIFPVLTPGLSDTASFDECLELLHMGGRSLPHAVLTMIPEAWENHEAMSSEKKAFYEYHAAVMEPWDGPASIAFSDGRLIGAVLDRNGLRPSRYWVTDDDLVIFASEVGVLDVPADSVVSKGRLQPGRMFLVDTHEGRIIDDDEIKDQLAGEHPYRAWLDAGQVHICDLPAAEHIVRSHESVRRRQQVFGYTHEELDMIVGPMAENGVEPIGSMGADTPIAILSDRPRLLFDYFHQLFAQVTNPPLDAMREELVTAMRAPIGPEGNLLEPTHASCRLIVLDSPVLNNDEFAKLQHLGGPFVSGRHRSVTIHGLYEAAGGAAALRSALDLLCVKASEAIAGGATILILSDRDSDATLAPIPSLLMTAAVHHHLVRHKTRTQVGLVVEAGDAREVHHMCLLLGYGAGAINPYLAFEAIEDMIRSGSLGNDPKHGQGAMDPNVAVRNYIKACNKGILKVMSKMGISTVASYRGAQVFEAIGLGKDLVDRYFTGTVSRLGGIDLDVIAREVALRHERAYPRNTKHRAHRELEFGGDYKWRREGEHHLFNPETIHKLQHSCRTKNYRMFKEYSQAVNDQTERLGTLRGLMRLRNGVRPRIPIDEVEPVSEIVKRFSTGAMSYGSISQEAHETLAIAMNRLGARSNTGEGGEDPGRFVPDANGDVRRSAIKQVASGRFGVTAEYLTNADDIQIKMAQGAKPGEGGQLPGHKVYPWIAKTRYSTAGVGLISPPPHHDIYSIEDLAQLIHDLKNANPQARIHVKLVSEVGVGTVAAGVSKAHADVVLISGYDGGTGASPLSSIKHAGAPWELGLAETQQTLVLNDLRDRIVVQVDGQIKTGRDVIVAALLGAEEFGFATAPLVVSGCVMMRVCHLDTCPTGIATQNPELRKRFQGKPEDIVTYFEFIAEEVRELLAELGFSTIAEAVGHLDSLDIDDAIDHWKASGLDLSPILHMPDVSDGKTRYCSNTQDHGLEYALDHRLVEICQPALQWGKAVQAELAIRNTNRTVGTILGHELTKRNATGLADDTIRLHFRGSAGQSFGAFVPRGITLTLEGDANDYFGKGLSGGRLVLHHDRDATFVAEEQVIAGNVVLYGATSGEVFIRGQVGERFCVRNSGAIAVVEGIGDHGCEYMTGGRAVILGSTGRNFGAGMSGGTAFIYDPDGTFEQRLNREMVDPEMLCDEDVDWLKALVERHERATRSAVADRILANWDIEVDLFVKVMPRDYKRVLDIMRSAGREGLSVDEAVMTTVQA